MISEDEGLIAKYPLNARTKQKVSEDVICSLARAGGAEERHLNW